MEAVLKEVTGGDEEGVKSALKAFIDVVRLMGHVVMGRIK